MKGSIVAAGARSGRDVAPREKRERRGRRGRRPRPRAPTPRTPASSPRTAPASPRRTPGSGRFVTKNHFAPSQSEATRERIVPATSVAIIVPIAAAADRKRTDRSSVTQPTASADEPREPPRGERVLPERQDPDGRRGRSRPPAPPPRRKPVSIGAPQPAQPNATPEIPHARTNAARSVSVVKSTIATTFERSTFQRATGRVRSSVTCLPRTPTRRGPRRRPR